MAELSRPQSTNEAAVDDQAFHHSRIGEFGTAAEQGILSAGSTMEWRVGPLPDMLAPVNDPDTDE